MKNILLKIRYIGTNYHGFAIQKNAVTISSQIINALFKLYGEQIPIIGCSRTDTGVHANEYCLNYKTTKSIPTKNIIGGLNANLPFDICVFSAKYVYEDFHARYNTTSKEYIYKILNSTVRNPFYNGLAYQYKPKLDVSLINITLSHLIGTHDFTSFCTSSPKDQVKIIATLDEDGNVELVEKHKSNIRTIYYANAEISEDIVTIKICGDGFLYNMVRIIVGTCLEVNENKIKSYDIPDILNLKNRSLAGRTAPPVGLYLNKVNYHNLDAKSSVPTL